MTDGIRVSQLPRAENLHGVEVLVGNQDGITKQFPVELFEVGGRLPPYLQPLSGKTATIPLPPGAFAAQVVVIDGQGAEVGVVVRHTAGQVQIESNVEMSGLTARLTF
ncbi:MAG: hypothetical protein EBU31_00050 [Proteobacteria bacterium]|nr:hypothetical protein [Pseudomonadota bacterium]